MSQSAGQESLQEHFRVEVESHKKVFEDKLFELNHAEGKLKIFHYNKEFPTKDRVLWKEIKLTFISKVRDARENRPKAGICFCISHAGDQMFVQADNVDTMKLWIKELNKASMIHVPPVQSPSLKPPNTRQEVAGGVIVPVVTKVDIADEPMPALSLPARISGYAVKQGGMRKNWKKRYFLLNDKGLHYYKDDQEKEPIKSIPALDIRRARLVKGEHHPHRQYLFEVITESRTFNIECDTESDCYAWVEEINKLVEIQVLVPEIKSDKSSLPQYADQEMQQEQDTKNYSIDNQKQFIAREKKQYSETSKQSYVKKRTSDEEETIPSQAVWSDSDNPPEVDRRSKSGLRGFSRKNWALW